MLWNRYLVINMKSSVVLSQLFPREGTIWSSQVNRNYSNQRKISLTHSGFHNKHNVVNSIRSIYWSLAVCFIYALCGSNPLNLPFFQLVAGALGWCKHIEGWGSIPVESSILSDLFSSSMLNFTWRSIPNFVSSTSQLWFIAHTLYLLQLLCPFPPPCRFFCSIFLFYGQLILSVNFCLGEWHTTTGKQTWSWTNWRSYSTGR